MSSNVLFEIGIEELPARFIDEAEKQLLDRTTKWLREKNIQFEAMKTFATPRRLAVMIENIAEKQEVVKEEVRGPQMKIAQDEEGNWSKAAIGFVKGQGKNTEDIYTKEMKGQTYIFVEKVSEQKATKEILPEFKQIISSIPFPQTMRWGSGSFRFARPIRWIVALYNDEVIPFDVANVTSSNTTRGHRFLGSEVTLTSPSEYEQALEENFVIVNPMKREKLIVEQLKALEEKAKFTIEMDKELLNEVRNLVEYPQAFYGSFDEAYLAIPEEVLITSMKEHQRYFPVKNKETNELLPYFVSVRNGNNHAIDNVIKGNEKVLRARLADGAFFFEEDRKHSIEFYNEKLKTVVFQEKIGTVYEKTKKVKNIATYLAEKVGLTAEEQKEVVRAAEICKFDLVTDMVNEFPELQGIMGEKYAKHFGESDVVATAIREHYLPTSAGGALPETKVGSIISIADKLDTIIGCISVGLIPSSSQDPLGLRRQAIGILRILLEQKWNVPIEELVHKVCEQYGVTVEDIREEIIQFFKNRAAYILADRGIESDVVQAVLADGIGNLLVKIHKARLLSLKRQDHSFKQIEESFTRVMNLGKKHEQTNIDETLFETDSERKLYETYIDVRETFHTQMNNEEVAEALDTLSALSTPINDFFDHNMVMAEDEKVKENRLALIHAISNLIKQFADVTLIEWKQHQ
ncbi:glycine--tRNA ligase subunit beta [Pseudogracilibacillus sp. ICA-222130]|uniref:glycine--tRNA ligase subunit beta n=1 Tax=Pseudogracilibacillus sp. ICA-222130 TaxID=3134655 RepID=UPI0030C24101